MTTVYALGGENDKLIAQLQDPDPAKRSEAAETIGVLHIYLALPQLLDVARTDPDESVRETARQAVAALLPTEEAAERAIAGDAPSGATPAYASQKEQAAAVIALFTEYETVRTAHFYVMVKDPRAPKGALPEVPHESDLIGPAIAYLGAWAGRGAADSDEVELVGASAIGAIARFLEIPPRNAGIKSMSFQDAKARVAEYESAVARAAGPQEGELR